MERAWPDEAVDFERAVAGALARAGGVETARRCEADPGLRGRELRPILTELGLLELDVHSCAAEAAAAARALLAAGRVGCPWPLVQQLAVPSALRGDVDGVYVRDGEVRRAEHLDLLDRAIVIDLTTGEANALVPAAQPRPMPLDPFGVPCTVGSSVEADTAGILGAYFVLAAFWAAGALDRAQALAVEHARNRRQFGRRIVEFGAIQWHLSDIAVARGSLMELAGFSLGRLIDDRLMVADVLALQLTTIESAQQVMTHAHQILAAMGLCEEHDLAVLDRHLQPLIRRPCGASRIVGLLADAIANEGFDNLYPVAAVTPA